MAVLHEKILDLGLEVVMEREGQFEWLHFVILFFCGRQVGCVRHGPL